MVQSCFLTGSKLVAVAVAVLVVFYTWSCGGLHRVLQSLAQSLIVAGHYTYLHMPCLLAIVDCNHVWSATASFKDTWSCGGLHRVLQSLAQSLIVAGHYTYLHMPCLIAIVDCNHVWSATASFKDLVTVSRSENSTNQRAELSVHRSSIIQHMC